MQTSTNYRVIQLSNGIKSIRGCCTRLIAAGLVFGLLSTTVLAAKLDIVFVVDETAGMAQEIANLQNSFITTIVPSIDALGDDVAYGVLGYQDFPVSPYGEVTDLPYVLYNQPDSNNLVAFSSILDLSSSGGGDLAEAALFALHTAVIPETSPAVDVGPQIAWRPGASRAIIWIGDAPSHDGDLEAPYGACCSDVGLADTIDALQSQNISVYALSFRTNGLDATAQASAIVAATGGTLQNGLQGGLSNAVVTAANHFSANALPAPPICDIQLSQTSYIDGETVTANVFRLANLTAAPLALEWKVWLGVPGVSPIGIVNLGEDGSFVLPAGTDIDLGPLPLLSVTAALPRGGYEFSCRMLGPVTGELLAEDRNLFDLQ